MYCDARYYYESVAFEMELFAESGSSGRGCFTHMDELSRLVNDLPKCTLNLHPTIDAGSRRLVEEFCRAGASLADGGGYEEVICPPCFGKVKCPVYVELLEIVDDRVEVTDGNLRAFTLGLKGLIRANVDFELELICQINFPYNGGMHESVREKVVGNEEFGIDFAVVAESRDEYSHVMEVIVTLTAACEDGEYLIGYYPKCITIVEPKT
jgi:hypothetical protein